MIMRPCRLRIGFVRETGPAFAVSAATRVSLPGDCLRSHSEVRVARFRCRIEEREGCS